MTAQEDDAVDSGWADDEDEPQSTRAVDSRLLLAQAGFTVPGAGPPVAPADDDDEPQATRAVDSQRLLAAAGLTRTAPTAENRQAFERETMPPPGPFPSAAASSRPPPGRVTSVPDSPRPAVRSSAPPKEAPVRGVGRRNTPIVSDAPLRARTLDATAKNNDAPALHIVDEAGSTVVRSYRQMSERSSQVANYLRSLGVRRGDRVLLMIGNDLPLWELMLACIKLGAVMFPASTLLTPQDLRDRLTRAATKA